VSLRLISAIICVWLISPRFPPANQVSPITTPNFRRRLVEGSLGVVVHNAYATSQLEGLRADIHNQMNQFEVVTDRLIHGLMGFDAEWRGATMIEPKQKPVALP
jgi:hypothetical protein